MVLGVNCNRGALVKCGCADVRIFEVVKCEEILPILSADVMGKCGCGNADVPSMSVCPLPLLLVALLL